MEKKETCYLGNKIIQCGDRFYFYLRTSEDDEIVEFGSYNSLLKAQDAMKKIMEDDGDGTYVWEI